MIIPEVIKTVNDPSLSQKNDQKAATLPAKTNEPTQENSRKQKGTTKSVTINHTLMPQRNDQQILSQQSTSKIILRSNSEPSKVTSSHSKDNENSALDKLPAPHTKVTYFNKPTQNFQSMLKEEKNSWNNLNESASPSSEEDDQSSKIDFSEKTKEQPIYLFPPNTDFPEDDQHGFYYRSDFPNYSHLQRVCAYFRLGPIYRLVISSLEYFDHQKIYPAQRPLQNNLKNDPSFMRILEKYADFYLDYDLEDPDNKANKQYIFINPHTKEASKRRRPPAKNKYSSPTLANKLKSNSKTKSLFFTAPK